MIFSNANQSTLSVVAFPKPKPCSKNLVMESAKPLVYHQKVITMVFQKCPYRDLAQISVSTLLAKHATTNLDSDQTNTNTCKCHFKCRSASYGLCTSHHSTKTSAKRNCYFNEITANQKIFLYDTNPALSQINFFAKLISHHCVIVPNHLSEQHGALQVLLEPLGDCHPQHQRVHPAGEGRE